jgi:starch synthase
MITTVSPRYAREITTELTAADWTALLRERQGRAHRHPQWRRLRRMDDRRQSLSEPCLHRRLICAARPTTRPKCRRNWDLPVRADIPLFGTVSRLADQKGVDIQLGALEEMLAADMQFVLLGSGGREFERGYRKLALRYPGKCAVKIGLTPRSLTASNPPAISS